MEDVDWGSEERLCIKQVCALHWLKRHGTEVSGRKSTVDRQHSRLPAGDTHIQSSG